MDISVYISELLYEHDCVIVPGFGGFVCNYRSAEIHPVEHTVSPPAKSISFNRHLKSNDGLLINYISKRDNISFDASFEIVYDWADSAARLLTRNEDLFLKKIGKLHQDVEGNLQFIPEGSVNYLKSSFGLRTITAIPVLRQREFNIAERIGQKGKEVVNTRKVWKIAAAIFLIAALGTVLRLMVLGIEIKPLNLDEANVFNFISHIFKATEPELIPIPIIEETTPVVTAISLTAEKEDPVPVVSEESVNVLPVEAPSKCYYIIIGAFAEDENVAAARTRLLEKYSSTDIITEKGKRITKIGYSAGNNFNKALEELKNAQQQDPGCWMIKKVF